MLRRSVPYRGDGQVTQQGWAVLQQAQHGQQALQQQQAHAMPRIPDTGPAVGTVGFMDPVPPTRRSG